MSANWVYKYLQREGLFVVCVQQKFPWSEKQEDQWVVVVEAALAPANMSIDNDAANVEGPTDDEGKTVRPESS